MINPTSLTTVIPAAGTFDFTPEGYARFSKWIPEDGFTWDDFTKQMFTSLEELETKRAEFQEESAGKLEVTKVHYWEGSLRTLFPERWALAYTTNEAWRIIEDKKVPLYSQLKHTLYFKSIIFGYGEGLIHKAPQKGLQNKEIAKYIKEHCASSARLKAISLRSYESVANIHGYTTWTSVSPPIFLCLTAAKSSLDAMSAVLWALLFNETPSGKRTPSMFSLHETLLKKKHPFGKEFAKLYKSSWFRKLQLARDKLVHRSGTPVVHNKFGAAFDFDLGIFGNTRPNAISVGQPRVRLEKKTKQIHLDKIMKGFVLGLEKWEKAVANKLRKHACFPSFNLDGIMLGVEFSDQNLLRDGSGPSYLLTSHPQGVACKHQFIGLHPFSKSSKLAPSRPPKSAKPQ